MMLHLLGSVPNKHVYLHLGEKMCRPGIPAALQYLIYNDVIDVRLHILPLP